VQYKTRQLAGRLSGVISGWPGVECVSLNEAALPDTLDPYFALILDVYYTDGIPDAEERNREFGKDAASFETTNAKDRFLLEELPVRIEYKPVKMIDDMVSVADKRLKNFWQIKNSGTYTFYRLANGEVLFSRSGWIEGLRKRLASLKSGFWALMRNSCESKMEHFLSDLGAAVYQKDAFFFIISSSGFIKKACLSLFCVNKRFEPSHRAYYKQVLELKNLPESFSALLDNFLAQDADAAMERKLAIAQLILRSIVSL
jgi:hypothetical protein